MSEEAVETAIVCTRHPGQAAVATCTVCGRLMCADCRTVDLDGLTRCVDCAEVDATAGTPELPADPPPRVLEAEPPAPEPPPLIAWERPDRFGDAEAFRRSALHGFLTPTGYMEGVPWIRHDLRTPLIFALLCVIVGQSVATFYSVFANEPLPAGLDLPGLGGRPTFVYRLMFLPFLPLFATLMVFVEAGITHGLLRLAGAARHGFEATFRIFAYARVAQLALLLPVFGIYVENIYLVFLLLGGMRVAHGAGFGVSLFALAPVLLQMLLLRGF